MANKKKSAFTGFDLKEARKRLGMNQIEFAEELCIARTSVIKAERTEPRPWMEAACVGLGGMRIVGESCSSISGARFSRLREKLGFSQAWLGTEWGVTERTIRTWEQGSPPVWALPAMVGLSIMKTLDSR